jgi:ribonuclease HI
VEAASQHDVAWSWVRGHHGHAQNEYANHLATRAAAVQTQSEGLIESAFEAWITESPAAQRMQIHPFPPDDAFRAARPLPGARPVSP